MATQPGLRPLGAWLSGRTNTGPYPLSPSNPDCENIISNAEVLSVLPSLAKITAHIPSSTPVSAEILALISTVHSLNTTRNQTALTQAQQLSSALNPLGIQPVALKGLANILTGIYPTPGCRYLADIDLLIPASQFPTALPIFQNLGYTTEPTHHPLELTIGHTHPPLFRPHSLEIDLHRTTGLGICAQFLPASELIRHSTPHDLGNGAIIRLPSPEHLLIHHIMHSQMHDHYRERINPSLRTLYDFFLLEKHFRTTGTLDWHAVEHHFRSRGHYATFALYLLEAETSMGVKPPIPLRLSLTLRLRRRRRQLLQQHPALRFFDPSYYLFAGIRPRTRRLHEILSHPAGIPYLLQKLTQPKFYSRLRHDFS